MAVLVLAAVSSPAQAQSIGDTLRQLRSTARQLAGGQEAPGAGGAERQAPETEADGRNGMFSRSFLANDASDTNLASTPLIKGRVETFDIRGFKLGMSPREVARIAATNRIVRGDGDVITTTGSFEVEAATIANRRLNRPVAEVSQTQLSSAMGTLPDTSRLALRFILTPDGPRVSEIELRQRLDGMTEREALEAKYGPRNGDEGFDVWRTDGRHEDHTATMQAVINENAVTLMMRGSIRMRQEAVEALEARAQQIARESGGGVRF